jgi:hypothetical protein
MTGSDRQEPAVKQILFGFDLETLFLRFDLPGQARQKLADGMRISINFTNPADRRLVLSASRRGAVAELQERTPGGQWAPVRSAAPTIAALDIVEAAVPFADLGLRPNPSLWPSSCRFRTTGTNWNGTHRTGRSKRPCLTPRSKIQLESVRRVRSPESRGISTGPFLGLFGLSLIMDVMLTNGSEGPGDGR